MFSFKQFVIRQDSCAMKVGTDGVLLGAWACVEHCHRILDVGTGTGLVALMAAQRSAADIVAIDYDSNAARQAAMNVAASPWKHRMKVVEGDVRTLELCPGDRAFDALLCNPPYFEASLKCPDAARTMARHTETLTFDELAHCAVRLLTCSGELSVIVPYDRAGDMTVSAACYGLFVTRQTVVYPVQGGRPKRMLMAFTRQGAHCSPDALFIQDASRQYTSEYIRLVKDFYLRM